MGQNRGTTKFAWNAPGQPAKNRLALEWDFAVDGGTIAGSPIKLRGDSLPSGAIVCDALLQVDTALDSAAHTATVALGTGEAANDICVATIVSNALWTTLGGKRAATLTATAAPVTTTADRQPTITVATQDLTQGKFRVVLEYYLPA